ncbi:MAG: type II and III secretion system protein:NolW, partial [Campylobacterales bacterium]|nr:type II and III secretion system protein:NolW [Campylobacterales bacterium]
KQEVTTQIILSHGETIIIGGLSKDQTRTTMSKVPLLGDIPLLGALFRHSEDIVDNQSMAIVITPYVVINSASLSTLQENLGILGRIQEQYNNEVFKKIEDDAKERLEK